jgi:hypothetical protein
MAIPLTGALWNWSVDGLVAPVKIHAVLADVVGRPVVPLGAADPACLPVDAVLCDVWHAGGEFPTSIDCYAVPVELPETTLVAAFARRLGRRCLLPDDTLDPGRFLLAAPDGTLRPVHLDVNETDEGPALSNLRLCTGKCCRSWDRAQCRQSRWAPGSVVTALAGAA